MAIYVRIKVVGRVCIMRLTTSGLISRLLRKMMKSISVIQALY